MALNFEKALRYPLENWIQCILLPGVVVYIDIVLTFILVMALILVIVLVASTVFHTSWVDWARPVVALLPSFTDTVATHTGLHGSAPTVNSWLSNLQHAPLFESLSQWLQPLAESDLGEAISHVKDDGSSEDMSSALKEMARGGNVNGGLGNRWGGILYSLFWLGFEWRLFAKWQKEGFDASAPEFEQDILGYFKDGLKGALFYIPLNIALSFLVLLPIALVVLANLNKPASYWQGLLNDPSEILPLVAAIIGFFLLLGLLLFFLSPFFIAPMVHSAQNRSVKELYDLPRAIEITLPRYPQILLAFLLILCTWLLYVAISIPLFCSCVGVFLFPFVWEGGFRVTAAHLLAQAFDYHPELPPAQAEVPDALPG
jgi:hypothetical protein